mgnify:FL=1
MIMRNGTLFFARHLEKFLNDGRLKGEILVVCLK